MTITIHTNRITGADMASANGDSYSIRPVNSAYGHVLESVDYLLPNGVELAGSTDGWDRLYLGDEPCLLETGGDTSQFCERSGRRLLNPQLLPRNYPVLIMPNGDTHRLVRAK